MTQNSRESSRNIASATEEPDARQLVTEARRIVGAVIQRQGRSDEDLEFVFGLLDHALEAMSR